MNIEKLTPWIPLLIAAGYFVFLIATYVKMIPSIQKIGVAEPVTETSAEAA